MDEHGILREFMQALVFRHEHNRYDKDNHLIFIRVNIQPKYFRNFKKSDHFDQLYHNISYDFNSITHYPKCNAFATKV